MKKKTAGSKADACGDTAGIFIAAPSLFSTALRESNQFSRHCGRSAGRSGTPF